VIWVTSDDGDIGSSVAVGFGVGVSVAVGEVSGVGESEDDALELLHALLSTSAAKRNESNTDRRMEHAPYMR
jgi:hypothetical protein